MWHACGKGELHIRFWWGKHEKHETDHLGDLSVDGWTILKWTFKK